MVKNLKKMLALMLSIIMIFSSTLMTYADDEGIIGSNEAGTSAQIEETVAAEAETTAEAVDKEETVTVPEAEVTVPDSSKAAITAQPEDASVILNKEAKFTVETNSKAKSCQWQMAKAGSNVWSNLSRYQFGSSETLKIKATSKYDNRQFRCIVTFKDDTTEVSDAASLKIVTVGTTNETPISFGSAQDTKVVAPAGAFPAGTDMEAEELTEAKDIQNVQDIVDDMADVNGEVLNAVDITFTNDGSEVQPSKTVSVTMNVGKNADFDNLTLVHIKANKDDLDKDNVEAEKVDFTPNKEAGTITFDATHFSTFALTWSDGEATIHWGELKDGTFTEFEAATLDTTASSVNLANNYDGYSCFGAAYQAPSADPKDLASYVVKKTDDGWTVTTKETEDETTTTETVTIADGSHIFVYYSEPVHHDPTPAGQDIPAPTTTKSVKKNPDGTYTITLDIVGAEATETTQVGANVLLVLDTTYSMASSMTGATNRFEAARSASLTLIDALNCGTNDIDLALVEFNSTGSIKYNWTKDYTTFRSYIANDAEHASGPTGTNWESGLYYARQVLNNKDKDNTYVIFLTDGEPNRRGTTTSTNAGASTAISYALTQAQAITAMSNTSLYGVFCGSASGYNNLNDMIEDADGVETINGTDNATINKAFSTIASTIVSNLGATNVSADDGITQLSSVSATVSGTASGYKYYKKDPGEETEFEEWTDAPGASFSEDNGVTWDLSSAGVLKANTTYRIQFDVWPSQEALDLVADLNNGLVDYANLDDEVKSQIKDNGDGTYSLLTNTHLNTTYTFKGKTYEDAGNKGDNAMELDVEDFTVKKIWNNALDDRELDSVKLIVTKDGVPYLYDDEEKGISAVEVTKANNWVSPTIYISCGYMSKTGNNYSIREDGHDYTIIEPEQYTYHWELTADVYHPMMINGEATMLILDDEATGTDGSDYYTIKGHKYVVATGAKQFIATNDRRSYLNITKTVAEKDAPADAYFTYEVKVKDADGEDVWFSVSDPTLEGEDKTVKDTDWIISGATAEAGNTGFWYAPSDSTIKFKIKAGWNVRFTNLRTTTTYFVKEIESAMEPGFTFDNAEGSIAKGDPEATPATVDGSEAEGTIDKPNTDYTVTYTNKYEGVFYVYHSSNNDVERYPMAVNGVKVTGFNLVELVPDGTLYGGYYDGYMGASEGFDAAALTYTDGKSHDEDGTPYSYAYIASTQRGAWNYATPYTAKPGNKMDPAKNAVYYLKEVPEFYLYPYTHYSYTKSDKVLRDMWYLAAIDDLNYQEAGFYVETFDSNGKKTADQIVDTLTIKNTSGGATVTLSPKSVYGNKGGTGKGVQAGYLTYWTATNLIKANTTSVFTPYWYTEDGIYVCGTTTRTVTFNNGKVGSGGMRITDAENTTPYPGMATE